MSKEVSIEEQLTQQLGDKNVKFEIKLLSFT